MLFAAVVFLVGIVVVQFFATLPNLTGVILLGLLVLVWMKYYHRTYLLLSMAFAAGFIFSIWRAQQFMTITLPAAWEGQIIKVVGQIASIPQSAGYNTTFLLALTKPTTALIRLNWSHAPVQKLWVGDVWYMHVRLKKIHGILNPGGLDYEALALQRNITATGSCMPKLAAGLVHKAGIFAAHQVLRQRIQQRIELLLPNTSTRAWILALLIGERSAIAPIAWEILRKTGTNHLIAIAGLHLGFMAAIAYRVTAWLWRLFPRLLLFMPAHLFGYSSALIMATIYAILSGFALPTQRALIMLSIYVWAVVRHRMLNLWQPFTCALLLVLVYDPFNVLTASFWLSFTTIAVLLFGLGSNVHRFTWWEHWYLPQVVISFGLLPLSILFFKEYSLVSLAANALAIPWVGVIILPVCFAGLFFLGWLPGLAKTCFIFADYNLIYLAKFLNMLAHCPWATWRQSLAGDSLHCGYYGYGIAAMVGVIILLLPRGFPGKILGWCWLLPLLTHKTLVPAYGDVKFTLVDVGQGLSAVIQTHSHTVVFDTGPRLSATYDLGVIAVIPFLENQAINKIDMLVISHGDNDHAGGAQSILQKLPVLAVKSSVPNILQGWPADFCLAGEAWSWDGVQFKFLFPTLAYLGRGNNSSCVLQVSNAAGTILLTGDIEAAAESWLVKNLGQGLAADIIVVPHHGSNTSKIKGFINYVHPQYALYAIGYNNRYHFPHPNIVDLYQQSGARQYDTASSGAIQFYLGKSGIVGPGLYRQKITRYWHHVIQPPILPT